MREKVKKRPYTIVVESSDRWVVQVCPDFSVSTQPFTLIAKARYSQPSPGFLKYNTPLYQPFMSAPDVFDRLIDVGNGYAFLGDYSLVTSGCAVSLADMPESLVAPNTFFVVHQDAAYLDVYVTSAALHQERALCTIYHSLYYDYTCFSAQYAPMVKEEDMQAVHAWLDAQDLSEWCENRLDNLCVQFFSSQKQVMREEVQIKLIMQDQADLFFCRALAQHTWLRVAIEVHYSSDRAVSAFLLRLDEAFRQVNKPVCHDYDRLFIDNLQSLTEYKTLLLARDWRTLRQKLFFSGLWMMDCVLAGEKLYKVQQILFRLSLLQSYSLPLKRQGASSLAVYTIQASILIAYVQSLGKSLISRYSSPELSQYVTPSYLVSVRRLTDLLARYVPPFLDKLFTFYDCWRTESAPGTGAYTQEDLEVLQRSLQADLQVRSRADESYHWLHFSYVVLPYYQKSKERLSQVLDDFCALEQQWLHRKSRVDSCVETMMLFWQDVLFKKTRDQSETVVQLLERAVGLLRGSSKTVDVQRFWCKYSSYWEFGLFNHTYFTSRYTAPTLVVGVSQRSYDASHKAMVQFFRRVDGVEGAPSSSFTRDEIACLCVFKKLALR